MRVVLVTSPGESVLAVIENWQGSVPEKGDTIERPPALEGISNLMVVKHRTWTMLQRGRATRGDGDAFYPHPDPQVKLYV